MNQQRLRVVRDSPNVIVPAIPIAISPTPGTEWSWGNYAQVVSSLDFPFLLTQLYGHLGVGASVSANGVSVSEVIANYEVATGGAGSEVTIAQAIDAMGVYTSVSGLVGDTPTIVVVGTPYREIPVGPVVIPASTRIAVRSAISNAPTLVYTRFCLDGYDLTAPLCFVDVPGLDKLFERGSRKVTTAPTQVLGSTQLVGEGASPSAYSQVVASFADETLVTGMVTSNNSQYLAAAARFDVSLGAAGNEVVQARGGHPSGAQYLSGLARWRYPFIAHKGERLAVRVTATAARVFDVALVGTRLS